MNKLNNEIAKTMHIQKITINNFRNFKDFQINFTEGFQTIIGENNVGKSNLYRAIRLVLDKNLSYYDRKLLITDFYGFKNELDVDDHILISIDFYGEDIASFPNLHAMKTGDNTARITYIFAHESKLKAVQTVKSPEIKNFYWKLYGGGNSYEFEDIVECSEISYQELEGVNIHYITAFRDIRRDLHGSTKSLLSKYCLSREDHENELAKIKTIFSEASSKLNNDLDFVPDISDSIDKKSKNISGENFSFPVSINFLSNYDTDVWNQLNLFFNPEEGKNIPINILGLGQKNILYLSLFLAQLQNRNNPHELNILLIEEPEAHLHPQLQKILFSNLGELHSTQVFMTSHSTHIASDCDFKNLNVLYKDAGAIAKSFSPFANGILSDREMLLLKRYLDATRSELFFASAVILVEGVGEQFIIPAIAKEVYGINLTEHNISVIPIHSRFFDPYLKLFQNGHHEIPVATIIDGDQKDVADGEIFTTAVKNAQNLQVENRVKVFNGGDTLEIDLFPDNETNIEYLEECFTGLGHKTSFDNLKKNADTGNWGEEVIKRIDGTVKKGRFAQELSLSIDENFKVPKYIDDAIRFIAKSKNITIDG